MPSTRILAVALVAFAGSLGCGGSTTKAPSGLKHPVLDRDYSGPFAGVWNGSTTLTMDGPPETNPDVETLSRVGFNRLAIAEMCPGVAGAAGLDSPTTFSMDPLVCAPIAEPCGPVTIFYRSVAGILSGGTLTFTGQGTAEGCGQRYDFTLSFTGTQPLTPPTVALASDSVTVAAGVPVGLDASGSVDPNGGDLQFSWLIVSEPPDGDAALRDAATATPTFIASVAGTYRVEVAVTSSRQVTAFRDVSIFVLPASATQSFVLLRSDPGDYIGGGQTYLYTQADALISVSASGNYLRMGIAGDEGWFGDFLLPSGVTQLAPGTYSGLTRYPMEDPATGGMDWNGDGRGCNLLTGSVTISSSTYTAGALTALDLEFVQHCENGSPAIHGQVHWLANDPTTPPGPVVPPPADLWRPAPGTTPVSGNYVFLQSDAGDWIGSGRTYTYTQANAVLGFSATGAHLGVTVSGDETWWGDFQTMSTLSQLQPGYYGDLGRYPGNPAKGGLDWGGGCNTLTGWFVVDGVTYSGAALTSIDLRFEQHCEGAAPALRGQLHWAAGGTTAPPGPVVPPPAGLWQPAAGATPASGNYVYLQSDPGDYVGAGLVHTYTQANAVLQLSATAGHLAVTVSGMESWWGDFQTMNTVAQLQPGYYGNLERYPFNNAVIGGLSWSGEGRGCNTLRGWFVVDDVAYAGGALTSIDLRFEQHCEGATPALHGLLHWETGDTTTPPGPVVPPPGWLWEPAAGTTPASGNYVYLQSDAGDYIGAGQAYTYTQANAALLVSAADGHLTVSVAGDQSWRGDFQTMNTVTQLQPGYYGGLQRYPFNNPVTGGLSWSGEGRGCNTLTGWFVVDGVTYSGTALTSIDLRFEQHCEGGTPALHGQIHWAVGDPTAPPGPVSPPPADLWQPAAGATPASGNYVYLQSDAGDYVGGGLVQTYTQANAAVQISATLGFLGVTVSGGENWWGNFQTMGSVRQLQPGYYGNLQRYPFSNPVEGGLSWWGEGRGCNTLTGWFAVDGSTYVNGELRGIDLRFEQHCEGATPALHGQIHWQAP